MIQNEQQIDKKKTRLLWRVFKWIGLSLLVLLLIAAVIYQAPWKVITLLAIVLAACTILPKPYRKWFWLSACAIVIALMAWVFLPDDNEGWRRYEYNFDKELAALEAKHSISDEQNAAISYNQLMESHDANDYYIFDIVDSDPDTFNNTFKNPWLSKDYPEIAERLKHIQSAIETLIEISKIKQCIFPISDPADPEYQRDRNSAIIRWARLMVIVINNDIAEGRSDSAVQKIIANLQMAKHLYQQPTTIDFLAGIYVETLAIGHLNRIVVENEAVDSHINIIEKALQDIKNDWNSVFTNIIEYDKLNIKIELTHCYEVNTKGSTRLSRDPLAQLRSNFSEFLQNTDIDDDQFRAQMEYIAYPSYLQKKLIKAKTILRWFIMPSDPEKAAEILDTCLDKYNSMTGPDFDWKKQSQKLDSLITSSKRRFNYIHFAQLMADKWAESKYGLHDLYLRTLALRRGSQLLIAIKQYNIEHGTWPDSLNAIKSGVPAEALIDPVTGNEFEYENHGERFSLFGETVNIWPK